jgi:lipid-A-disaccharide synthase
MGVRPRRVLVVAGDPSGDAHAARMVAALRERDPGIDVAAVGGPALKAAGATMVADLVSEAVVGFSEVIRHLPGVLRIFALALAAAKRADLVVFVDYPGFNLALARAVARLARRPKMLYYIAPQVWAWHQSRAALMERLMDRIAVVFPFEERLFPNAVFVGHPLLDLPAPEPDPELGAGEIIALLPGSRQNEIRRHLPIMREVARRLTATGRRPILSLSDRKFVSHFAGLDAELYSGDVRRLLASSSAAVVKSGTATLEAALLGVPIVVLYRLSWFSWVLGKALVRIPRIAMPNILLDEDVAPELIQAAAAPANILDVLERLDRDKVKERFARLRGLLGNRGSAATTADLCLELMG